MVQAKFLLLVLHTYTVILNVIILRVGEVIVVMPSVVWLIVMTHSRRKEKKYSLLDESENDWK